MSDDLMRPIYEMQQNHRANRGAAEEIDAIDQVANHIEAQAAEIARLRAACDASEERVRAIELRFWQTVDRDGLTGLPSDMWAALNQLVQDRAALATARREGMEAMAEKIAGWHETRAEEWDAQEDKFKKLKTISSFTSTDPGADGLEFARQCAQAAAFHRQRAAAIRAAAKEGK